MFFVMAYMNYHLISLSSDYRNNDSSPLVRTKTSFSSDSHHSINSHSVSVGITVSERFSGGSLEREISLDDYSFNDILFY